VNKLNTLCAAVVVALSLSACGGGSLDDGLAGPLAPPAKQYSVPDGGHKHLLLFRDAAEPADYSEIAEYPYVYSVDSHSVVVGSTNPSASAVRVWVVDLLGTAFISDLRVEK
jgi:hypothetical protein